jgi:UDP-N-acetyl-D-mannosaminuronate dehydrogenase
MPQPPSKTQAACDALKKERKHLEEMEDLSIHYVPRKTTPEDDAEEAERKEKELLEEVEEKLVAYRYAEWEELERRGYNVEEIKSAMSSS